MAVSIPVSADASSVLRSLSDIQAALRRVGAEARDLGSLDLSHPELRAMSADLEKVGRQFEDMRTKVRGATGASVRSIVGDGQWLHPPSWIGDPLPTYLIRLAGYPMVMAAAECSAVRRLGRRGLRLSVISGSGRCGSGAEL